jgi:hypothetical protein
MKEAAGRLNGDLWRMDAFSPLGWALPGVEREA